MTSQPLLAAGLPLTAQSLSRGEPARAAAGCTTGPGDSAVPGAGFAASRYEVLWTKSPFAVATTEVTADSSPDYFLVGISNFDGISYASVVETKTPQEHFLISTDKPTRGLTLTSITRSHDGLDTYAVVQKDGQSITLKLEQPPAMAAAPGAPPVNPRAPPGIMAPQITMPGANVPMPGSVRPFTFPRTHRPPIHLPPMPAPTTAPTATPTAMRTLKVKASFREANMPSSFRRHPTMALPFPFSRGLFLFASLFVFPMGISLPATRRKEAPGPITSGSFQLSKRPPLIRFWIFTSGCPRSI